MPDTGDCITCRFWLNKPEFGESGGLGICRRRAPVAVGSMALAGAGWPVTGEAEWCGEYEAHPASLDD